MAQLPDNIRLIDTHHLGRKHVVASYLLLGDAPALIDPGPSSALHGLEAGLEANGLRVEDLRVLLLTHIHLDHAGATGTLLKRNPKIQVYVHQIGAPHMIDPTRLLRSATRLYGDQMDYLWGEFLPAPAEHVTVLQGGETLQIGQRRIDVRYAPGHASHHVIYHEADTGVVWIGDNGGIRMPGYSYARPATPPPDIDIDAWQLTFEEILAFKPSFLALTHFGAYDDPALHIANMRGHLAEWAAHVRQGLETGASEDKQIDALRELAQSDLGPDVEEEEVHAYAKAAPIDQCWRGLARYWQKRQESGSTAFV